MSRQNKVNPGQYTIAGRLSPDDLGRERGRQRGKTASTAVHQEKKPAWESSSPSPKIAPSAPPGRLKVAAKSAKASARTRKAPARTPPSGQATVEGG